MANHVTETDRFVFFWRGWPSQWIKSTFVIDGVTYNCCEQFMMAEKVRVFADDAALAKILETLDPREQQAPGRRIRNFDLQTWNRVCRGIVYSGNLGRFSQNKTAGAVLLATGEKTIVEASPTDRIWGIGLAHDDPRAQEPAQWPGTNWLGVALMQVRDTLRASGAEGELDPELREQLDERRKMAR